MVVGRPPMERIMKSQLSRHLFRTVALAALGALAACTGVIDGALGGGGDDDGPGPGGDGGGNPGGDAGPLPPLPDVEEWTPRACGGQVKCVGPGDSIQDAIAGATTGDIIQVAGGTYNGSMRIEGTLLTLVGGHSADFSSWDPEANPTIVNAAGSSSVVYMVGSSGTRLQGFVLRGGSGQGEFRRDGGGVQALSGDYVISGNVIENNDVGDEGRGGGIYLAGTGEIVGNVIRNNRAHRGAGIEAGTGEGRITVAKNIIEGNTGTGDHAGGMFINGPDLVIAENLFQNNQIGVGLDYGWGGGMIVSGLGTTARSFKNVFKNNHCPLRGANMFIDDEAHAISENDLIYGTDCTKDGGEGVLVDGATDTGSVLEMINATIANNCPSNADHAAIYVETYSTFSMKNSIVYGNGRDTFVDETSTLTITNSLLEASFPGSGNMTGDPLFANAAAGDFHPRSASGRFDPATGNFTNDGSTSPTIDMGDSGDPYDAEPAPNGGRRNLGHTGNTAEASRSP